MISTLKTELSNYLEPRLRRKAETDPSFKQIIPYAIVGHVSLGMFFVTRRIGGDARLLGKISLGIGGHVEEGETVETALFREMEEEIDLPPYCVSSSMFCGFLNTNESEVDRVHVGMVYRVFTVNEHLRSHEPDKLEGYWATLGEIRLMREQGLLESWSELVFDHVLEGERGDRPWLDCVN